MIYFIKYAFFGVQQGLKVKLRIKLMKARKLFRIITVVSILTFVFLPASLSAGIWPWGGKDSYNGNKNNIETVIITGNYVQSRLIADLVLAETNQPYILIPSGNQNIVYFCPASKNTMIISDKDFSRFLWFLNPNTIFVLGGKKYIPEKYLRMINPAQKAYILSDDWLKTTEELHKYMGTTNLLPEFKKHSRNSNVQTQPLPTVKQAPAVIPLQRPVTAGGPVLVKDSEIKK